VGLVIVSAGVRTDIEIAKKAGLEIGTTGGIKVNARLESNIAGIYSAGDCAESISAITKEPITSGLGTIAARQGVVAGANAAGADIKAPPIINAFILRLFHKEIGSAGLTESHIKKNPALGFTPVSTLLKYPSLPHYYPGGEYIYTKLIADSATGRVLGGQIMGSSGIGSRVNMLSLLIESGRTVEQIVHADFAYSPPCSDTWDPLSIVAQGLLRKIR
jgi:NADPH-dependent 2,4-dienoyl-CoA reductase/sulfur reductase-like enzyme